MIYLMDANSVIDAKRDYFQFNRVPEYWDWLLHQGQEGNVKIPIEIYEEFEDAKRQDGTRDALAEWASEQTTKNAMLLSEEVDRRLVATVLAEGYPGATSDTEIAKLGRDPFIMAYALVDPQERLIVSTEVSRPKAQGGNRKLPDACTDLGIRCINNFQFISELDFTTDFKRHKSS